MLSLLLLLALPQDLDRPQDPVEPSPTEAAPTQDAAPQDAPALVVEDLIEVGLPLERSRVDLLPPAGALGGGWMMRPGELAFSVEQSLRRFRGMRDGRERVDARDELASWSQARRASMSRWAVNGRYGLSDHVTLSAVVPVESRRVSWATDSERGRTSTHGLGDVELLADVRMFERLGERLIVGAGLIAPTGEHDARGAWSGAPDVLLPYWLQLGGGSWQGLVTASWIRQESTWSWGAGARGTLPLEKNDSDWARERSLAADAWAARPFGERWVGSARVQASGWSDVRGAAAGADPSASPLEDNGRQGGDRLEASLGLAYDLAGPGSTGATNRLELSVGAPLWEDLDGPGPAAHLSLGLRWRASL